MIDKPYICNDFIFAPYRYICIFFLCSTFDNRRRWQSCRKTSFPDILGTKSFLKRVDVWLSVDTQEQRPVFILWVSKPLVNCW